MLYTAKIYRNRIYIIAFINLLITLINLIQLAIDLNTIDKIDKIKHQTLTLLSVVILPTINILLIFLARTFIKMNLELKNQIILYLIIFFYICMIGYGIYITTLLNNINNDNKEHILALLILSSIHFISYFILFFIVSKLK